MAAIACLALAAAGMPMAVRSGPQQESRCLLDTMSIEDETSLLQVGTFPMVYNPAPKAAANVAIYRAKQAKAEGNALWAEADGVKDADQWASYEKWKQFRNHAWAGEFSLLQINSSEAAKSMTLQLPMQGTAPQQAAPGTVQFSVQAAQQQAGVGGAAVPQQPAAMAMPQQPAMGQQPAAMAMPQQQAVGMPQPSPLAAGMPMQQQPAAQAAVPQAQNGMASFEGLMQAEGLLAPEDAKYPQAAAAPQQGGLPQPMPGFPAAAGAPQQPANMATSPTQPANMAAAPPGAPSATAPATAQAPDTASLALKVFDEFKKGKYTGAQCRQNVAALFTEDAVVDFRGPQDTDFFKLYSPGHDGVCDYFAQCSHYAANDMKANLFAKGDRIVLVWDYVPGFIGPNAKKASGRISQYNIMSFNPEKTHVNRFEALFDKPSLYDELKFDGKKPPVKTPQMAIVAKVFASFAQGNFYGQNCKKNAGALFAEDAIIDMTGEGDANFFKKYPPGVAGVCEYYQNCYDYVMNSLNASMYARGDDVIMVLNYVPGLAPKESLLQEKSILLQESSLLQRQAPAIPQDPVLEFYVVTFNPDKSRTRGLDVFHLPFGGAPDAGQGQAGAESLVSLGSKASQPIGAPAASPAVAASGPTAAGAAAAPAAAEMTQMSQQTIQLPYASFADSNYGASGNGASQNKGASPSPMNSAPQSLPEVQVAPSVNMMPPQQMATMMPPQQTASMMPPQQMASSMPQQQMMSPQASNMIPQQLVPSMMSQQQMGMSAQAPGMVPHAAAMAPQSPGVMPQLPGVMGQTPASYAGYGASVAPSQLVGTGGSAAGQPAPQLSMPQQTQTQNALDAAFSAGMRTGLQTYSGSQSPVPPIQLAVQPESSMVQPPQSQSWPEHSAAQPHVTYSSSFSSGPPNLGSRKQPMQSPLQQAQAVVQANALPVDGQKVDPDVPRSMQLQDLRSQREMEGPASQAVDTDGGAAENMDEQTAMISENREGHHAEDLARAFDIGASVQGDVQQHAKLSQEQASAKSESDKERDERLAKAAWRATASMKAMQIKQAEEERGVLAAQARNQAVWESKVKETLHGKSKVTPADLNAEAVTKALRDGDMLAAASVASSVSEAGEVVKAYKAEQVAKAQKATAQAVQADKVAKLFNAVTAGNSAKSHEVAAEAEKAANAIKADSIANAREAVRAFGKADQVAKALAVVAGKARAGLLAVNISVNHTISSTSGVNHSADSSVNQSVSSTSSVNQSADSEGMYKLDTFNCGLFGGTQLWSAWQGGNSAKLHSKATSATKTLESAFSHNMNEGCITLPSALSTSSSQINMVALAGCRISFFSFPLCRGDEYRVLVARRRAAWVKSNNVPSLGLDPFGTIESVQCSCR